MKKLMCLVLLFSFVIFVPDFDNNNEAKAFVNDFKYKKKVIDTYTKWGSKKCAGPYVVTGKKSKEVSLTRSQSFSSTVSATIKGIISPGATYTVGKDYGTSVTISKYSKGCGAVKVKYKYEKYRVKLVDKITGEVIDTTYGTKRTAIKNSETFVPKYVYKNNKKKALKELK